MVKANRTAPLSGWEAPRTWPMPCRGAQERLETLLSETGRLKLAVAKADVRAARMLSRRKAGSAGRMRAHPLCGAAMGRLLSFRSAYRRHPDSAVTSRLARSTLVGRVTSILPWLHLLTHGTVNVPLRTAGEEAGAAAVSSARQVAGPAKKLAPVAAPGFTTESREGHGPVNQGDPTYPDA